MKRRITEHMKSTSPAGGTFVKFGFLTIVTVYLLILAGGIVRTTGSGMGCPDWPTCFGRVIPPTHESQLPPDYQEKYKDHGYGTATFNPLKTWIEYINRLLGALTGLFVLILFFLSFRYLKVDKKIVLLSGLALVLIIIEGLLGMLVVYFNLKPEVVTVHLWGSILVILILIYLITKSHISTTSLEPLKESGRVKGTLLVLMIMTAVQIVLGTQVRQQIDEISIASGYTNRESWIDQLSPVFIIHRSFSILLLVGHVYLLAVLKRVVSWPSPLAKALYGLFALILLEIVAGIMMNYMDFPSYVQPLHMLFAIMMIGVQFYMFILLGFSKDDVKDLKLAGV